MRVVLLTAVLLAATASAQPALVAQPALGETSFANSGSAQAQEPFLRGLLLLHSFEYDDAREAFQRAREIDPGFAMAAWGEAMTHNHPVWQRQDRDAALAALGDDLHLQIGLGLDLTGVTLREERYLMTLRSLFVQEKSKEDRDDDYADAMRQLAADYPDDLDARAFYALALLGTAHEGRDVTTYIKAAAVAEDVFAENPRHPGAAHYLIHAYDDPVHAPLGLRPALVYAEIAPSASHALHMPSHIYLALGLWPEVREMNARSYLAAKASTDRRLDPALNGHGWHALWWWHYAATQLGDRQVADRLLALAVAHAAADSDGETALAHATRIASQHALAFGDEAALDDPAVGRAEGANSAAILHLARGVMRLDTGRTDQAAALAYRLDELAASDGAGWTVRSAALQLRGRVEIARGHTDAGLAALADAARIETEAPLTFGPPSPVVPSNEALGLALFSAGRPAQAQAAFQASLDRAPGRRQSVAGLAAAQAAQ